jgi:HrpA-like RNA helicase
MKKVILIRNQLKDLLIKMDIPIVSCGKDIDPVRRTLASGFFLNAACRVGKKRLYKTIISHMEVRIHPSSIVSDTLPKYIIFTSLVETSKLYIRDTCSIECDWLYEISPTLFKSEEIQIEKKSSKNYQIQHNP